MILVTGAGGYVGRLLIECFERDGLKFKTIGRRKGQFNPNINVEDLFSLTHELWTTYLEDVTTLVHLAWFTKPNEYQNSEENAKCLQGSKTLIDACKGLKIKRVVIMGSCMDLVNELPSKRKYQNKYSKAKTLLYDYSNMNNSKFLVWTRLHFIYGDREPKGKLYKKIKYEISDLKEIELRTPDLRLDFIEERAAADQILAAVVQESCLGIIEIKSGELQSVKQFCKNIFSSRKC